MNWINQLLKKLDLQASKALESYKFHLNNGDKYKFTYFFNGKRAQIREFRRIIKKLKLTSVSSSHSTCENCGGDNVDWGTTDELWNKVADHPKSDICPQCFVKMAESKLNYESVIVGFNAEVVNR